MPEKYRDIEYLKSGSPFQRHAYHLLKRYRVFESLKQYGPLLTGTIPIGINIPSSDLDIVCEVYDRSAFADHVSAVFVNMDGFELSYRSDNVVVCRFDIEGIPVELFGAPDKPYMSNSFRHMIVEDRLLRLAGDRFRERVIELKNSGMKTEPAFAAIMGLDGDPYEELLSLESYTDEELMVVSGII